MGLGRKALMEGKMQRKLLAKVTNYRQRGSVTNSLFGCRHRPTAQPHLIDDSAFPASSRLSLSASGFAS